MQHNLNPIACDPCRSKKCKCDRTLPACSQCQSPQLCRYQEGGKRGLPVAYMTSLENRLQETENALLAAMDALRDRGGIGAVEVSVGVGEKGQPSKAEKQREWKRWRLRTGEEIGAWAVEKRQKSVNAPIQHPLANPHRDEGPSITDAAARAEARRDASMQLQSCRKPMVPNGSCSPATSAAWMKNYF